MPARRTLWARFWSAAGGILHHYHPFCEVARKLCFESSQQSLAAQRVSDYHLCVIPSRFLAGLNAAHSPPRSRKSK